MNTVGSFWDANVNANNAAAVPSGAVVVESGMVDCDSGSVRLSQSPLASPAETNTPTRSGPIETTTSNQLQLLSIRGGAAVIPPVIKAGIQSAAIMTIADLSIQILVEKRRVPLRFRKMAKLLHSKMKKPRRRQNNRSNEYEININKKVDTMRTLRWAVLGCTLHGPYFFSAFKRIDRLYGPATSFPVVVQKTLTAQLIFFPPYLVAMFSYMGYMEGLPRKQIIRRVKTNTPKAFKSGCVYWPVVNTINFGLVEPSFRVLYTATAAGIWNGYLSYMNAKS